MDENLREAPLFKALDDEAATSLRKSMLLQELKKGQTLFKEGQTGDRLYLVKSGKVKLSHASGDGRESVFMVLGPGDMFGELSLFDPGPRTSTAIAVTDSEILGLGHSDLKPWLQDRPEVAQALLQALAHRLRRTSET
ncbi:MAG: hypothetical protein RLZZ571_743, partial [Actinomycetota bacterium]